VPELTITTPALLFPAISLLLLAYTNRFLVIAQLIRSLYKQYNETADHLMKAQIQHLRKRSNLIRHMQIWGVVSFIACTLTMFDLFAGWDFIAYWSFAISLLALLASLLVCLVEIVISGAALEIQLQNLEK
jgi:hypothetical protein